MPLQQDFFYIFPSFSILGEKFIWYKKTVKEKRGALLLLPVPSPCHHLLSTVTAFLCISKDSLSIGKCLLLENTNRIMHCSRLLLPLLLSCNSVFWRMSHISRYISASFFFSQLLSIQLYGYARIF